MKLSMGPDPSPELGPVVLLCTQLNKLHRTLIWKVFVFFSHTFLGWGVFQDSDTFVNKERKLGEQGAQAEKIPAVHGPCLAPPSLLPTPNGATGCCSRYLDYLSSHISAFAFPPGPHPAPPAASPSMHVARRHTAEQAFPGPEPFLGGAPGRAPPSWWAEPGLSRPLRLPPRPALSVTSSSTSRPSPTDSETQREERKEKPDTHKGEVGKEGGD